MSASVRLLDATVRDGGYIINHHFSKADVGVIVGALDRTGIPLIEVGHGMGLGCHLFERPARPKTFPFIGEEDHAEAARAAVTQARLGVLFVAGPQLGPLHYIDRVAELGFDFVRIAVMPRVPHEEILPYVSRAKRLGLTVGLNLMQSYALSPAVVGELARAAAGEGADWFFLVDSAGGMRPDEVKRYVELALGRADLELGLHSHNNAGGAVSNCLAAVEAGATLVDGSLNGIGRSTGNAPTEQLAMVLRNRLGHRIDIDGCIGLGRAVRTLFDDAGNDPFDVVSGGARIHSRNVPKTLEIANERGLRPAAFLLEVGREASERHVLSDLVFSDEVYEAAAQRTSPVVEQMPPESVVGVVEAEILARWRGGTARAIEDLLLRKHQHHKLSALHLSGRAAALGCAPTHWEGAFVGLTIPWTGEPLEVEESRRPDLLLVEEGSEDAGVVPVRETWCVSFDDLLDRAARDLALALRSRGYALWVPAECEELESTAGLLNIACGGGRPEGRVAAFLGREMRGEGLSWEDGDCAVVPVGTSPERVDDLRRRGVRVFEPDWTAAVARVADSMNALVEVVGRTDADDLLVEAPCGRGSRQARWDPDRAALREVDGDLEESAAHRAGARRSLALWTGRERF